MAGRAATSVEQLGKLEPQLAQLAPKAASATQTLARLTSRVRQIESRWETVQARGARPPSGRTWRGWLRAWAGRPSAWCCRPRWPGPSTSLNDPRSTHDKLFRKLLVCEHDPEGLRGFRDPVTDKPTATHLEVALLAHAFLETPHKERGSIVSTLQGFLALWGDEVVARNSWASDFSVRDFLSPEPISLYVALPYGDLTSLAPLLRVLLALLTRALTDEAAFPGSGALPRRRIHFFLDEFASLGRVSILEEMLAFFRDYAVRAHVVVQDLDQICRNYSDRESITGNCPIHVSAATRAHVSGLSGDTTVCYERRSQSGGKGGFLMDRTSIMPVEARRPLLTQGEAGSLPKERLVILKTGLPPILAGSTRSSATGKLARRAAYPPPVQESPAPPVGTEEVGLDEEEAMLPEAPPALEDEPPVPPDEEPAPGEEGSS